MVARDRFLGSADHVDPHDIARPIAPETLTPTRTLSLRAGSDEVGPTGAER